MTACEEDSDAGIQRQQVEAPDEAVRRLRSAHVVAKGLGEELGSGPILLPGLSASEAHASEGRWLKCAA